MKKCTLNSYRFVCNFRETNTMEMNIAGNFDDVWFYSFEMITPEC